MKVGGGLVTNHSPKNGLTMIDPLTKLALALVA